MSNESLHKNLDMLCSVSYHFDNFTEYVKDLKLNDFNSLMDLLKKALKNALMTKNKVLLEKKIEYISKLQNEWTDELDKPVADDDSLLDEVAEVDEAGQLLSELEELHPSQAAKKERELTKRIGELYYLITGTACPVFIV